MKNHLPNNHLFLEEDIPLMQTSHTFIQGSIWLERGMANKIATYDLFVREMPANRNYMIAGGLEEIVTYLKKIKFSDEDINFLLKSKLVSKKFAEYLRNFKFTGSIWAMPEGTVFFPYEPIIRISAPIIEASLIEYYLMTVATSNVMFFSKAARLKLAAQGKFEVGTGMLRGHSFEGGAKGSRAGYVCGLSTNSQPNINKKYKLPIPQYLVNAQHLFITSFPDELTAFRTMAEENPDNCSFMIDTYDFEQGLSNAILVGKELKAKGHKLGGVCIDSGEAIERTKYARKRLDAAGLSFVHIYLAGNYEEKKIAELVKNSVPCDGAYSVTEYNTLSDSPKLEIVYKLSEVREDDQILYAAKLTPGKLSYPGRKQIFRKFKDGKMIGDIVGLDDEKLGEPLLIEVMKKGNLLIKLPNLEEIKDYIASEYKKIPEKLLDLDKDQKYPVVMSEKIEAILGSLRTKHQERLM